MHCRPCRCGACRAAYAETVVPIYSHRIPLETPSCKCFSSSRVHAIHTEAQDTECDAWNQLLDLIDRAVASGATEFAPGEELGWESWWQIVTLPPSISRLKSVKRLVLYGSNLDRIPPEIGEMVSLEEFDPYASYRLHWYPYEITRCRRLKSSRISTRALYGNYQVRHPFPRLYDTFNFLPLATPSECSVCRSRLESRIVRRWISLNIATDVVPLLVNACSLACIGALPDPADGHVQTPHRGGSQLEQPAPRF
jgi:hypothetical protein